MSDEIRFHANDDEGSVQVVVTGEGVIVDWFDSGGECTATWAKTFPDLVEFLASLHAPTDAPTAGFWVFEPGAERAWGPFDELAAANAFIEADKYLSSWAAACDAVAPALARAALYPPSAYR